MTWAKDKIQGITPIEESEFYEEILDRIIHNPRFYLNNLDDLEVFKFSFIYYKR